MRGLFLLCISGAHVSSVSRWPGCALGNEMMNGQWCGARGRRSYRHGRVSAMPRVMRDERLDTNLSSSQSRPDTSNTWHPVLWPKPAPGLPKRVFAKLQTCPPEVIQQWFARISNETNPTEVRELHRNDTYSHLFFETLGIAGTKFIHTRIPHSNAQLQYINDMYWLASLASVLIAKTSTIQYAPIWPNSLAFST